MVNNFRKISLALLLTGFSTWLLAQTTVSGTILDDSGEPLIGVNVLVKGTVLGTITDIDGTFKLNIKSEPPLTLVITSVGFERQEIEITNSNTSGIEVMLAEATLLGQEVVVSASRVEETILRSPVSVEKMDILAVQNTSADTYYKAIANLKGVDVATSSINFQIINARGFGNTGNTRFVQLIDGMDTQAPALNFPIGNLNGPSQLDVESVELIPGAASALYGPNAFNGVLIINSKSPFDYQGLSAYVKQGVNHINTDYGQPASPMYEASLRYAKSFNNKFAFKVNGSYMRANDWHGIDMTDRNINPFESIGGANPGADRLHLHGDEAGINMNIFRFSRNSSSGLGWEALATTGSGVFFDPVSGQSTTAWQMAQNGFLPNHVITAPSYAEEKIVDYGAENAKVNVGLFYRLTDQLELSYMYNAGFGTSIYTGAQRYSLANFGIQQHRLQLRSDNFYVRAYTTRENSGDSYIAEFLTLKMNEERLGPLSSYFGGYGVLYLRSLFDQGYRPTMDASTVTLQQQLAAHQYAQGQLDDGLDVNGQEFEDLKAGELQGTIPEGPYFADKSNMYHGEFQYDFKNEVDFMELQIGGSVRQFELRSQGTIFPDTTGAITINEFGGYVQAGKNITDDFKLSGSVRFDKNQNFNGQVNPRISGVYTIADNHNFRLGYQTGFRNPTTQGQYISLDVISARLLGGLPQFFEFYDLARTSSTGVPIAFTGGSVRDFRNQIFNNGANPFDADMVSVLDPFTAEDIRPVKPERVKSVEAGYRSLIDNKLLVDFVYYYNIFDDFITQIQVNIASEMDATSAANANASTGGATNYVAGDPAYNSLLNGSSTNTFQIYTNMQEQVKTQGLALGLTYSLPKGYNLGGNYSWNQFIGGYTNNTLQDFNTPEHKFNINFGNRKVTDNLGFNVTYRWQEAFRWESSFAQGTVPSYQTVDAQVSYRMKPLKSILKIGGSNIMNKYYIQSLGGPSIGAIYYISITFDELMN